MNYDQKGIYTIKKNIYLRVSKTKLTIFSRKNSECRTIKSFNRNQLDQCKDFIKSMQNITVQEGWDAYLRTLNVKSNTIKAYNFYFNKMHWIANEDLKSLNLSTIHAIKKQLIKNHIPSIAHYTFKRLQSLLKYCVDEGFIKDRMVLSVEAPPYKKKVKLGNIISENELPKILSIMDRCPSGNMFKFLLYTGVRLSNALEMRWEEIKDNTWEVPRRKTKTSIPYRIQLTPDVLGLMGERQESGYVFDKTNYRERWDRIIYLFGRQVKIHDLRRTFAAMLYKKSKNIAEVSACLHHHSVKNTMLYLSNTVDTTDSFASISSYISSVSNLDNLNPTRDATL